MSEKTKINVPYRVPDETCRNPKCDRPAMVELTSAGDLCTPCYDAYMLGQRVGKKWMGGYLGGGDPAAVRYPFWKE